MSSTVHSIEDLNNAFPTTVTPITGEPNYASLKSLKDKLEANAASIPTTLGGSNHGYLGLILSPLPMRPSPQHPSKNLIILANTPPSLLAPLPQPPVPSFAATLKISDNGVNATASSQPSKTNSCQQ